MQDYVDIELDPPRVCRTVKRSYWLEADGVSDLQLPIKDAVLFYNEDGPEGLFVKSVRIPRWLAEDRGLLTESATTSGRASDVDEMTRDDWFLLGATMALLIRGDTYSDAVWNARTVAAKLETVRRMVR